MWQIRIFSLKLFKSLVACLLHAISELIFFQFENFYDNKTAHSSITFVGYHIIPCCQALLVKKQLEINTNVLVTFFSAK